jgi:hypothetical protein
MDSNHRIEWRSIIHHFPKKYDVVGWWHSLKSGGGSDDFVTPQVHAGLMATSSRHASSHPRFKTGCHYPGHSTCENERSGSVAADLEGACVVMMLTALTDQSCKERRESKTHRFFEKITEFDRLSLTKDNIIITGRKKQFNVTQNAVMKIVTTGKSVCL